MRSLSYGFYNLVQRLAAATSKTMNGGIHKIGFLLLLGEALFLAVLPARPSKEMQLERFKWNRRPYRQIERAEFCACSLEFLFEGVNSSVSSKGTEAAETR